jgi:hypothetical protein
MKRILAVIAAAAVLGAAGVALGAIRQAPAPGKALVLQPGQAVTYAGLTCTTYKGTTPTNANIVCVRNNLAGFGVVVSQQQIIIAKKAGSAVKVVFKTKNR